MQVQVQVQVQVRVQLEGESGQAAEGHQGLELGLRRARGHQRWARAAGVQSCCQTPAEGWHPRPTPEVRLLRWVDAGAL